MELFFAAGLGGEPFAVTVSAFSNRLLIATAPAGVVREWGGSEIGSCEKEG